MNIMSLVNSKNTSQYRRMIRRALVLAFTIVASANVPASAQDTPHVIRSDASRSVVSGDEVRIFSHTTFDAKCEVKRPPKIDILSPPSHGSAYVCPEVVKIDGKSPTGIDCIGHVIHGLAVWYAPDAGFHGSDRFVYRAARGNDIVDITATIIVQDGEHREVASRCSAKVS
jgi:hypothetical protein